MEINLNKRRQQLADLYNYESTKWREESLAKVETQEDRKARLLHYILHNLIIYTFLKNF